jgi:hypothetical protein
LQQFATPSELGSGGVVVRAHGGAGAINFVWTTLRTTINFPLSHL